MLLKLPASYENLPALIRKQLLPSIIPSTRVELLLCAMVPLFVQAVVVFVVKPVALLF